MSEDEKVTKSEREWQAELPPDQFAVCRQKATERAFTGKYCDHHEEGVYRCAACRAELFGSATKYDSGSGWPSFFQPIAPDRVANEEDRSHGMRRVEILCTRCGSHLGHLFDDGPRPTGQRYCVNSLSLDFEPGARKEGAK